MGIVMGALIFGLCLVVASMIIVSGNFWWALVLLVLLPALSWASGSGDD